MAEKAAEGADSAKWRKHCWVFASFFWPRQGVNYSKLMDIHSKLVRPMRFLMNTADSHRPKTQARRRRSLKPSVRAQTVTM